MTTYNPCMKENISSSNFNLPFKAFFRENRALSADARDIEASYLGCFEDYSQSITYQKPFDEIKEYWNEIIENCSDVNWNGYAAEPFDNDSFLVAAKFINLLPDNIQRPEITADSDGEVVLEWFNGPGRMFSISFGRKGVLSYAGIFGINKTHGKEYFESGIPSNILEKIKRVFRDED